MFQHESVQDLIQPFYDKYLKITTGEMHKTFLALLSNYQYQTNILNNSKLLIESHIDQDSKHLL